jgi:Tfp pilus assembly major pilin PilA
MNVRLKKDQRGISFLGLLFFGGIIAVLGVIAAQVVPTAIEYQAVVQAAQRSSSGGSVAEVRSLFQKSADIDNVSSITGKDIEVTKSGDRFLVSFSYQREIHLVGPAFLTLKYAGKSQ